MRSDEMIPVGIAEIAKHFGRETVTIRAWKDQFYRDTFPKHRWIVSGKPAWDLNEVIEWARTTRRDKRRKAETSPV